MGSMNNKKDTSDKDALVGAEMDPSTHKCIVQEQTWILSQYDRLEDLLSGLGLHERSLGDGDDRTKIADYWRNLYNRNALIRSRQLLQHNIIEKEPSGKQQCLDTMGVLITMRYLLELRIWGRLIEKEDSYAFVLYFKRMSEQKKQYERTIHFWQKIIDFLRKEKSFLNKAQASRGIRVPSRQEKNNILESEYRRLGIGFLRSSKSSKSKKVLRKNIEEEIKDTEDLISKNDDVFAADKQEILEKHPNCDKEHQRWRWNNKAKDAGMFDEYELFYAEASDLLHAGPFSFITDSKELEPKELKTYVSHIRFSFEEILDRADKFLESVKG